MKAVASSQKEKESDLVPTTSLAGTKWTVEKPETRALGEWIEFGHKLRSASDEEIICLISSVATYVEEKLNEEKLPTNDD